MPFVKSLPARNEHYVFDKVQATWLRIIEDGIVTSYEIVEMAEMVDGVGLFAKALTSSHAVQQATPRATDEEYYGGLVAVHQARMSRLPDAA